jgi:tetratricopeptide (TPR) repeat protein
VGVLEHLNHPKALYFAYHSMVINVYFLGRITEMTDATDILIEIGGEVEDKWVKAFMLFAPGMVALISGNYAEAQQIAESALDLCEERGDVIGATLPMIILGHVALSHEEYERARGIYLRVLNISEKPGFIYSLQTSSKYLAKVSLLMGDYVDAEKYLVQCLTLSKETGFVRDMVNLVYEFARFRVAQNNLEEAIELLALVIDHPASNQTRWLEGRIRDSARNLLAELEAKLSPESYTSALGRGQGLDLEEIVSKLIAPKN